MSVPERATVHIWRTDGEGAGGRFVPYEIDWQDRMTVLGAVQHVYERVDATLAFRFGCRFKNCGLCGMRIDGHDHLACRVHFRDGMHVGPLNNLPAVRDLVVDRRPLYTRLRALRIFPERGAGDARGQDAQTMKRYETVMNCVECLACQSMCPHVGDGGRFPGAFFFVKLAQMKYHPGDAADRDAQARELRVDICRDCRLCECPYGVEIQSNVIGPFLGEG